MKKNGTKWLLLFLLGIILYSATVFASQQKDLNRVKKSIADIQAKIEEEDNLSLELQKQKKLIKSEQYIEQIARERLGMVKDGEKVFVDINE